MNVLLFGATGAAGGAVLARCLAEPDVARVRTIARRPLPTHHPKLETHVHDDYLDYDDVAPAFEGMDAVLWCLGISVRQVSGEDEYRRITVRFPEAAAKVARERSPGTAFHYLSGGGARADSRQMWARVKAEAERSLRAAVQATCWRPAFIDGADSASSPRLYQAARPLFRLLAPFRSVYVHGEDLGAAMLRATRSGMRDRIIENREIRHLAEA